MQRRLVMGTISPRAGDDETGGVDLLTSVLRACLTFAGRRLSWHAVSHSRAKRRSSRASSWCACAVRVLRRAISPDYATAYDVFREQLVRFPGLCAAPLAAHDRATTDRRGFDYGPHAWPFVLLAAASSTRAADATSRKAANAFETSLRKLRRDEMDAMFSSWFAAEEPRRRLLEQCVARPARGTRRRCLRYRGVAHAAGRARARDIGPRARGCVRVVGGSSERLAADWNGGLSEEEERAVTEATTRLRVRGARGSSRRAHRRAATRVAVRRVRRVRVKLLEARAASCGGDSAGAVRSSRANCSRSAASTTRGDARTPVSRGDESARARLRTVRARRAMGDCRAIAADAARVVARVAGGLFQSLDDRPGEAADAAGVSASSLRALPAAMRVVVRHARGASDVGAAIESARAVRRAFARGKDAEATRENASSFVALAASIETLLDEAAILPSDAARLFPSASDPSETDENYLLDLVETHLARGPMTSTAPALVARGGVASLLDVVVVVAFEAEHRAHVVAVAARCVRDASSPANVVFEDGVEGRGAVRARAAGVSRVDVRRSDARASPPARVRAVRRRGGRDAPGELFARITTEEERVRAARAVATRANSALGKNKYEAVGRAAGTPPRARRACFASGARHDARPEAWTSRRRRSTSSARSSPRARRATRPRVRPGRLDEHASRRHLLRARRTRRSRRERRSGGNASPGDGFGGEPPSASPTFSSSRAARRARNLSDATAALLREMERTLRALASREDDASDANARRATTDAAAATQEVVNAILVFTRARRKGAVRNGRGKDDAAPSTSSPESSSTFRLAVPAVGCARRCLEAATREASRAEGDPEDDPLFAAAADLRRAVEILLRRRILPDEISRALEPWHRELFFERARAANAMGASAESLAHADDLAGRWTGRMVARARRRRRGKRAGTGGARRGARAADRAATARGEQRRSGSGAEPVRGGSESRRARGISRVGLGRPVGFRGVQTGQGLPPAVGIGRATRAIRLASAEAVARPRRRRSRAEDNPKDEEVPARPKRRGATRRRAAGTLGEPDERFFRGREFAGACGADVPPPSLKRNASCWSRTRTRGRARTTRRRSRMVDRRMSVHGED